MARVVKKNKNNQETNKKPFIIGGSVAGAIALVCLVVGLVLFFNSMKVVEQYTDSRSISFETLQKLIDKTDPTAQRYEMEVYVYVFNSDVKSFPANEVSEEAQKQIQLAIDYDKAVQGFNIPKDSTPLGFYTLDLYDEDNFGLLSNENFGNVAEGPFVMKLKFNTNGNIFQQAITGSSMTAYLRDNVVLPLNKIIENNQDR